MKIEPSIPERDFVEDKKYLIKMDVSKSLTELFKQLVIEQPDNPIQHMRAFFEVPQKTFYFVEVDDPAKGKVKENLMSYFTEHEQKMQDTLGYFEFYDYNKEKAESENLAGFFARMKDSPIRNETWLKKMKFEENGVDEILKTEDCRVLSSEENVREIEDDYQFSVPVFILGALSNLKSVISLIKSGLNLSKIIYLKPNCLQDCKSDLSFIREKLPKKSKEIYFQTSLPDITEITQIMMKIVKHDIPFTSVTNVIVFSKNSVKGIPLVNAISKQLGMVNLGLCGIINQAAMVSRHASHLIVNSDETNDERDLQDNKLNLTTLRERLLECDVKSFGSLLYGQNLDEHLEEINWSDFQTVMVDYSSYSESEVAELEKVITGKYLISIDSQMELNQLIKRAVYYLTI